MALSRSLRYPEDQRPSRETHLGRIGHASRAASRQPRVRLAPARRGHRPGRPRAGPGDTVAPHRLIRPVRPVPSATPPPAPAGPRRRRAARSARGPRSRVAPSPGWLRDRPRPVPPSAPRSWRAREARPRRTSAGREASRPAEVRRGRASPARQLRGAEGGTGRGRSRSHPLEGATRDRGPRAARAALRRLGPAGAGGGLAGGTVRTGRIGR